MGKPWFSRFNPTINWRTHEVILDFDLLDPWWLIDDAERFFQMAEEAEAAGQTTCNPVSVKDALEDDEDDWISGGAVSGKAKDIAPLGNDNGSQGRLDEQWTSTAIDRLLHDYADCFPKELPNELPVSRAVEFGLTMKPDARPSPRAPFRLSKTEHDALKLFVDELLRKKWIETSDSPWISSIFRGAKEGSGHGRGSF